MSTAHRPLDERHHLALRLVLTALVVLVTGAAVGAGLALLIGRVVVAVAGTVES